MKTFFEKVTTVPFPRARISVAALRSSGRGARSASSNTEARSRANPSRTRAKSSSSSGFKGEVVAESWSRVFMEDSPANSSKNLTKRVTEHAENRERTKLAEQVFGGGTDDAGGGFEAGLIAISANEHDRRAFGLVHEKAGGGGELIGDSEDGCGEKFSLTIAGAAQVEEYGQSRGANGDVGEAQAPGAAKGIANNDGNVLAGLRAHCDSQFSCRAVRVARQQGHDVVARDIRMVDAGVGADETMVSFRDEHVVAADDAPRLIQDHLHCTGILSQPRGKG